MKDRTIPILCSGKRGCKGVVFYSLLFYIILLQIYNTNNTPNLLCVWRIKDTLYIFIFICIKKSEIVKIVMDRVSSIILW